MLLDYFTKWIFSIPKLFGYILTFSYKDIIDNKDENFLLYIGFWFIFIGLIFYIAVDNFDEDSK